jgi:tellurite resistance-related uncharacterized protein
MSPLQAYALPPNVVYHRSLGPWNADEIPAGLKGQHQLKSGSWAIIKILSGKIDFAWDDNETSPCITLETGMELTVPPLVLHHLVLNGPVVVSLSFFREGSAN